MEGKNVRKYLFLGFFIILLILVARLFMPFMTIIIWAGLLYAFLGPLYDRITGAVGPKPTKEPWRTILAAGMAILAVVLIVVPVVLLAVAMIGQLRALTRSILDTLALHPELLDLSPAGPIGKFLNDLTQGAIDLSAIDLRSEFTHFINGSAAKLLGLSGFLIKNGFLLLIALLFIVFTLFFLFLDGREILGTVVNAVPIEREYSRLFLRTLSSVSKDLAIGYFLVSIVQGLIAFLLFSAFDIKGALVLGALTVGASFIPMLGTGLVWGPISLGIILTGDLSRGLALLALSAVLIAGLDNILRIFLLRDRLKIHPLLIFFAIIGGIDGFGFNGLILGPLILMSFLTGAKLYNRVTQREEGDHGKSDIYENGEERKG